MSLWGAFVDQKDEEVCTRARRVWRKDAKEVSGSGSGGFGRVGGGGEDWPVAKLWRFVVQAWMGEVEGVCSRVAWYEWRLEDVVEIRVVDAR